MRRQVGIAGLQRTQQANQQFREVGNALQTQQLEELRKQLEKFRTNLEAFAIKYKKDIKRDPVFRMHFQRMCNQIGIDPLASTKGFWSDLLGIGDFYYELGIQVAECCLRTRDRNGGLIDLKELKRMVEAMRGRGAQEISEDDILRALKSLEPLGNGFEVLTLGNRKMVSSVPRELNVDHSTVLNLAQSSGGFVTLNMLYTRHNWTHDRATTALEGMVREGICWVDLQASPTEWWVPGFFGGED